MSAGGVPVEEIARVAGHRQTSTTELVYRRELRPVITTGAELMDKVFPVSAEDDAVAELADASPRPLGSLGGFDGLVREGRRGR
jgi:hypothetical protein